jgi:hypothetical protein
MFPKTFNHNIYVESDNLKMYLWSVLIQLNVFNKDRQANGPVINL